MSIVISVICIFLPSRMFDGIEVNIGGTYVTTGGRSNVGR